MLLPYFLTISFQNQLNHNTDTTCHTSTCTFCAINVITTTHCEVQCGQYRQAVGSWPHQDLPSGGHWCFPLSSFHEGYSQLHPPATTEEPSSHPHDHRFLEPKNMKAFGRSLLHVREPPPPPESIHHLPPLYHLSSSHVLHDVLRGMSPITTPGWFDGNLDHEWDIMISEGIVLLNWWITNHCYRTLATGIS